jgi:hypothetical protein
LDGTTVPAIQWDLANKSAGSSNLMFKVRVTSYPYVTDSMFNTVYAVMNGDTISATKRNPYRFCDNNNTVTMNITGNDTAVCYGSALEIRGTYCTVDCSFGDSPSPAYSWEFRHVNGSDWQTLESPSIIPPNCNVNFVEMTKTLLITSVTEANEGYYRMSIGDTISDSVYVHLFDKFVAPEDIRIQICPSPPEQTVQLTGYLNSLNHYSVKWKQVSPYPAITDDETGEITGNFVQNGVYTYNYTMTPQYPNCRSTSAKVYIHARKDRIFGKPFDTITVCSALDMSKSVNLNRIFGLELGGTWSYPNDEVCNIVKDNVKEFVSPSKYAGAMVFNAQKAYTDADADADDSYDITYKGISAKKFDFEYSDSCVAGATKRITLIVTE